MEQAHRDLLVENLVALTGDLDLSGTGLMDHLVQAKVILPAQRENIEGAGARTKQVQTLLQLLPRRGKKAFPAFVTALKKTGQGHLAELLTGEPETDSDEEPAAAPPKRKTKNHGDHREDATVVNPNDEPDVRGPLPAPKGKILHVEAYPMPHPDLGNALIINNYLFDNEKRNRAGSDKDAKDLQHVLGQMGFSVTLKENRTTKEIGEDLDTFCSPHRHQHSNCALAAIMTHGRSDGLQGREGKFFPLKQFTDSLCKVTTLVNKPKILIIQACRGNDRDSGEYQTDSSVVAPPPEESQYQKLIPGKSDVFTMYATVDGQVSWRSVKQGAALIECINNVFKDYHRDNDLQRMYTKIKDLVANKDFKVKNEEGKIVTYKQSAESVDRLRFLCYFRCDKKQNSSTNNTGESSGETIPKQVT